LPVFVKAQLARATNNRDSACTDLENSTHFELLTPQKQRTKVMICVSGCFAAATGDSACFNWGAYDRAIDYRQTRFSRQDIFEVILTELLATTSRNDDMCASRVGATSGESL